MAVAAPKSRRSVAALALLVTVTLAGPGPGAVSAEPMPAVSVPKAKAGMDILVRYASDTAFTNGGRSSAASAVDNFPELRTKVFRANHGQEQKAMRALASESGVMGVESDVEVHSTITPNDPMWRANQSWQHDKIGLRPTWDISRGAAATVIAVLDTGVDGSHDEFTYRMLRGYDAYNDDYNAWDDKGHGTMSAGVAAARGGNGLGVTGGCWFCSILPVKVLSSTGSGYASRVTRGILWAANNGADVINMSFGGFAYSQAMADGIKYARAKGAVVVASAGNEGNTAIFYPAAYPGVISVAAYDANDAPYSWSTRGSWVDLAAPGCLWTTARGDSYVNFCGTSAAAPLVAGLVGALRSAVPSATVTAIEAALLETATPINGVARGRANGGGALSHLKIALPLPASSLTPAATGPTWREKDGRVVIEAETGTRVNRGLHRWSAGTVNRGYAGTGYIHVAPDAGYNYDLNFTRRGPQLRFPVRFARTGTYTVWVRTYADDPASNAWHMGLDGVALGSANRMRTVAYDAWSWSRGTMDGHTATINVATTGTHVIDLWMREDGLRIDRIVLTRNASWVPTGAGPAASARY
jgi:subtilisin family serine protease